MAGLDDVALFRALPGLVDRVPWVRLGAWPTPIEPLPALVPGVEIWVKREDLSSPVYGGNKVRTLEAMLGRARAAGATEIWATGAYGSNHAVATVLHARAAGLDAGAVLFPQPASEAARANLRALLSARPSVQRLRNVIELPFAMAQVRRARAAAGARPYVMAPGGATPEGTFGAMSAALELADQIERGVAPAPARLVVAVGSACTTAGLLAGLALARRLGVGFSARQPPPPVTAVRVTPWPITSALRIATLALRTVRAVDAVRGVASGIGLGELRAALTVEAGFFGGGYGRATAQGVRARAAFARAGGPALDIVYSAKSAAALLELVGRGQPGPVLFWATKSSAPLPSATVADVEGADPALQAWLRAP